MSEVHWNHIYVDSHRISNHKSHKFLRPDNCLGVWKPLNLNFHLKWNILNLNTKDILFFHFQLRRFLLNWRSGKVRTVLYYLLVRIITSRISTVFLYCRLAQELESRLRIPTLFNQGPMRRAMLRPVVFVGITWIFSRWRNIRSNMSRMTTA